MPSQPTVIAHHGTRHRQTDYGFVLIIPDDDIIGQIQLYGMVGYKLYELAADCTYHPADDDIDEVIGELEDSIDIPRYELVVKQLRGRYPN